MIFIKALCITAVTLVIATAIFNKIAISIIEKDDGQEDGCAE
ncbi:MAG: hypothetical protein U0O22_03990 [Acutalibacteraceae bacterium]